jgi:transposase-like protein
VAIVWVCRLGVDAYQELGRQLDVPRFDCPRCGEPMILWGWYDRYLRVATWCKRVWIRRQRCKACRRSHVVLPQFVTHGRLDELSIIAEGIEAMVMTGRGARRVGEDLGLPHTTVRDWRRRFRSRAVLLAMGVAAAVVALAGTLPRLSADPERAALQAMAAAWAAVAARRSIIGSAFSLANAICGSHLLSTNMQPPWAVL